MSKLSPSKIIPLIALLLAAVFTGCSHQETKRGHLFRCDWAFEYNRTPWVGLPADSGYSDDDELGGGGKSHGLFNCLKKDSDGKRKGFRRHCAMNSDCTAKKPCCRTLGCGMWVNPNADSTAFASLGGTAKACGLTPFCSPQKPCRITPNCGKPTNVNVNPQTLMMSGQQNLMGQNTLNPMGLGTLTGRNFASGNVAGGAVLPNGTVLPNGSVLPNGMAAALGLNSLSPNGTIANGAIANGAMANGAALDGTLVSRGIVPGASTVTTGGIVAAIGVSTPAGTMTPVGVRMPNGMVNNSIVLRACTMTPNCTAANPCGLTPACGGMVAVRMVSNNAVALASALQAQGVAGGVMQAGGMGMLVNPMTNQPVNGVTMAGYPQVGYPPIGYAPTGYAPGYPRYAAGLVDEDEEAEETADEAAAVLPETRSAMPVPRFHPIPSKPAFQRSEGMSPQPQRTVSKNEKHSEQDMELALDQAYLEGVSAAMNEVERKLDAKRQAAARTQLQEKILQQSENVQQQLAEQDELRMRQIRQQQAMRAQSEMLAVSEPKRLAASSPQKPMIAAKATNQTDTSPAQLAGNLKTSVVSGVNGLFAPLVASNQKEPQRPATPQSRQNVAKSSPEPKAEKTEVAVTPPNLPGRPPVSPLALDYGLQPDDESDSPIMQAHFTADGETIRP